MKFVLPIAIAFALSSFAFGQQFEYGSPADLKGLNKVYLDTGLDTKLRERIMTEVKKALPDLEFLGSADKAEIVMVFRDETVETVTSVNTHVWASDNTANATSSPTVVPLIGGQGSVFVPNKDGTKPKLVLTIQNSQQSRLEKRPSTKFANAFIKAYKEANGLK